MECCRSSEWVTTDSSSQCEGVEKNASDLYKLCCKLGNILVCNRPRNEVYTISFQILPPKYTSQLYNDVRTIAKGAKFTPSGFCPGLYQHYTRTLQSIVVRSDNTQASAAPPECPLRLTNVSRMARCRPHAHAARKVKWGERRWGEGRWGEVREGEVRWGNVRWGQGEIICTLQSQAIVSLPPR